MEPQQLLEELSEAFERYKKEHELALEFDAVERELFLTHMVLDNGFVTPDLGVAIRNRMMDMFNSWYGYLHGIMLPNPQSMPMHMEAQFFDDAKKTELQKTMHKMMHYLKRSYLVGLARDKKDEARFIEEAFSSWTLEFKPAIMEVLDVSQRRFLEESNTSPTNNKRSMY